LTSHIDKSSPGVFETTPPAASIAAKTFVGHISALYIGSIYWQQTLAANIGSTLAAFANQPILIHSFVLSFLIFPFQKCQQL
jgi:hypothetical protein